jgi:ABC-2 type transport system ATP-binding protein
LKVLEARGIGKSYGQRTVLRDVDFALSSGEIVGLIGPNGAGKTTLLRILLRFVQPSRGRVASSTAAGAIEHFGGAHTLPPHVAVRTWARLVSRGEASCDDRRPIRALSRGSRQLLGLSAVLARSRLAAVLLDEPWEGLDPDGARWLSETLLRRRGEGCAFLVSSHRLHDLAGLCERYAFLTDGRIEIRAAGEVAPGRVSGEDLLRAFDRIRVPS